MLKSNKLVLQIIALSILTFSLFSCNSKPANIAQKWQLVSFEDPFSDSMEKAFIKEIDTATEIQEMYVMMFGTDNKDSIIAKLKQDLKENEEFKKLGFKTMALQFRADSVFVIYQGAEVDSSQRWYALGDTAISISRGSQLEGEADDVRDIFKIEKLTSNRMRLKLSAGEKRIYMDLRPFTQKDSLEALQSKKKLDSLLQEKFGNMNMDEMNFEEEE